MLGKKDPLNRKFYIQDGVLEKKGTPEKTCSVSTKTVYPE